MSHGMFSIEKLLLNLSYNLNSSKKLRFGFFLKCIFHVLKGSATLSHLNSKLDHYRFSDTSIEMKKLLSRLFWETQEQIKNQIAKFFIVSILLNGNEEKSENKMNSHMLYSDIQQKIIESTSDATISKTLTRRFSGLLMTTSFANGPFRQFFNSSG